MSESNRRERDPFEFQVQGILLDVEGTTSSISFVHEQMFPFARKQLATFLKTQWKTPALRSLVPHLIADAGLSCQIESQPFADGDPVASTGSVEQVEQALERLEQGAVLAAVNHLMDRDAKITSLKKLQGWIWKVGFESGDLVAHLWPEVASQIQCWQSNGVDLRIYSSGSVDAQRLFFGHTVAGNLLQNFSGHYDTQIGGKRDPASYRAIAADWNLDAAKVLFISDVLEELQAADAAGMHAVLSDRPGNLAVVDPHPYPVVQSFDQIKIMGSV